METQRGRGGELLRERLDQVEKTIRRVAKGQHLDSEDAKELRSQVLLKLVEDGESIFRKYRGEACLETYLAVVVRRVWLDHQTGERGRWRPSAQARRMGPLAIALDRRIHRDGLEPAEALEDLKTRYPNRRQELEDLVAMLPNRPKRSQISTQRKLDALPARQRTDPRFQAAEVRRQGARLQDALGRLIRELPDEEQDLLKQRYCEGWTVRRIAISRGEAARPLYRRFEKILRRLRGGLERHGLSWPTVAPALEEHAATFDLFVEGFSKAIEEKKQAVGHR